MPIGTIFRNIETREILTELTTEGSFFLAAKGGAGGRGNSSFKSSENQAPRLAEAGGEGEKYTFNIGKQNQIPYIVVLFFVILCMNFGNK